MPVAETDSELARQGTALCLRTWPSNPPLDPTAESQRVIAEGAAYDGPAKKRPMLHMVIEQGTVIALARTFERIIGTQAGKLSILALSGVVVEENRRGQGLGRAVVQAAMERVDHDVFSFSLFQTEHKNQGFYEGLGAMVVNNPVINSLAQPGDRMPSFNPGELAVVYPNKPGWPSGTIDLLGSGY